MNIKTLSIAAALGTFGIADLLAANGDPKWATPFSTSGSIYASPAIGPDDTIYFGSDDGFFYAVKPDKTTKWAVAFNAGARIRSSATISQDGASIYFGAENGKFYRLSTSNGAKLNEYQVSPANWIHSTAALNADGSRVYFVADDGFLYAMDQFLVQKWKVNIGASFSFLLCSSPAVGGDGTVYVASSNGHVYGVTPTQSSPYFSMKFDLGLPEFLGFESSISIGPDGNLYVGDHNHTLYGITPAGAVFWRFVTGFPVKSSPVIDSCGKIFFGSDDNFMYAAYPGTAANQLPTIGNTEWFLEAPGSVCASLALAADGTSYFTTFGAFWVDRLHAVTNGGTLAWTFPAADQLGLPPIYSSPAIGSDGTIYFGCTDGKLYAVVGNSAAAAGFWPNFRLNNRHSANAADNKWSGTVSSVTVVEISQFYGGYSSFAYGVNDCNDVAGYADGTFGGALRWHAYRYSPMTDLGSLYGPYAHSAGYAINNAKTVAGSSYNSAGMLKAVSKTLSGAMVELLSLGGANSPGTAAALTEGAFVAGYSHNGSAGNIYRATRWLPGSTTPEDLGNLGPFNPAVESYGFGVNNARQVVGRSRIGVAQNFHAFATQPDQLITPATDDLGSLAAPTNDVSEAYAINNVGQIVGSTKTDAINTKPFLKSPGGAMTALGSLGGTQGVAYAINNRGQVVGFSKNSSSVKRAFVWLPLPGWTNIADLNNYLSASQQSIWTLREAWGMNDSGRIVGWGTKSDGSTRGFILYPN